MTQDSFGPDRPGGQEPPSDDAPVAPLPPPDWPAVASAPAEFPSPTPEDDHADVMAEIERIQNKRGSWATALAILVVSIVLFMGLGSAAWSFRFVLILLPILFIHELGHWIGMKAFGYGNVRMFFIPLFGAAVMGKPYNVAGWKKGIVSLLGPVPGIAIGAVLGIAGAVVDQPLLIEIAILTLVLNAFNLLPILPLDGGWVVHMTLFCRHWVLDGLFRLAAALALIGLGLAMGAWILMGLGGLMLFSLPVAFKMARITQELRESGVTMQSPDNRSIPRDAAIVIIERIKTAFAAKMSAKTTASHTIQVFETLNGRPPGPLASLALLGVHAASFGVAAIALVITVLAMHGGLAEFISEAALQPQYTYVCGSTRSVAHPSREGEISAGVVTVVAQFEESDAAESAFDEAAAELPDSALVTLFGNMVLLELPADSQAERAAWVETFESTGASVAVARDDYTIGFTLTCLAPTVEAAELIQALANASCHLGEKVAAPWNPDHELDDAHVKARRTYLRLLTPDVDQTANAELEALAKELITASRRGDESEAERLQEEISEIQKKKEQARLDAIRALGPQEVDLEVIDLHAQSPLNLDASVYLDESKEPEEMEQYSQRFDDWYARMAKRLGPRPLEPQRYCLIYGFTSREISLLRFHNMTFRRPAEALPAFAQWLCDRGCTNVQYEQSVFGDWWDE